MSINTLQSYLKQKAFFAAIFLCMLTIVSDAQDSTVIQKDSSALHRAIYWTKKGEPEKARKICKSILAKNPSQVDAKILLGRLYSWDKQFDSSRIMLNDALQSQPRNEEALHALVNVELWSKHYEQAIIYSEKAILLYPKSQNLWMQKAKIYYRQGKYKEAAEAIDQVLVINPINQEAIQYRDYFKKKVVLKTASSAVGISYFYDQFSNTFTPWSLASLYYWHKGKKGSISTHIHYANRFNASGIQYELDLNPRISSKTRAYLGAAYSIDSIFPKYNLGASLYHTIFKGSEIEAGVRYLYFPQIGSPIFIYSGAFSFSINRFWGSVKTYLTPQQSGLNQSYFLTGRYSMKKPNVYFTLILGKGLSPQDYLDPISGKNYNYPTRSDRVRVGYQTTFFSSKNILKLSGGYENRTYFTGFNRTRMSGGIGYERLF